MKPLSSLVLLIIFEVMMHILEKENEENMWRMKIFWSKEENKNGEAKGVFEADKCLVNPSFWRRKRRKIFEDGKTWSRERKKREKEKEEKKKVMTDKQNFLLLTRPLLWQGTSENLWTWYPGDP